jgi:hypothetical protein
LREFGFGHPRRLMLIAGEWLLSARNAETLRISFGRAGVLSIAIRPL